MAQSRDKQTLVSSTPPNSIDAEQSTIGAMLIERAAIKKAAEILHKEDFYREDHQALFQIAVYLDGRDVPCDFITVKEEVKRRGLVISDSYLAILLDKVPTAASVEYYANIVRDKANLRRLTEALQESEGLALHEGNGFEATFERVQSLLDSIRERAGRTITVLPRRKPLAERILDMADITEPTEADPLIWWVLTRGMIHWLSAPSGLGKSTLVYNIVTAIAERQPLWGLSIIEAVGVLYVDLESGDHVRARKLERLYAGSSRVRGGVRFLSDIRLPEELSELIAYCQAHGIGLVVLDTAARTFRLESENDNAEVGRTITPILDALKSASIASLVIDHTGKSGRGARGASAKSANVDVVLSLELHRGKETDADAQLILSVDKHKLLEFPKPLILERMGGDHFKAVEATESDATPGASVKCASDAEAFIEERQGQGTRFTDVVRQMVTQGHAEGTARRVVNDLQKAGRISHNGVGYVLADPFVEG